MNKIEIKNMNLYYSDFHALKDVNLDIEPNKITAFIGPSGCGKSTFFHLISGITKADSGKILFDGKDLCELSGKEWTQLRATQISYVLQGDSLLPNFSVLENICLPHQLCGSKDELEKRALELLKEFGLTADNIIANVKKAMALKK